MYIHCIKDLKTALRNGPYAWPGGHALFFVTSNGGSLQYKTVLKNVRKVMHSIKHERDDGWRVIGVDINWEDDRLLDDETGELIECAYPQEENQDG